MCAEPGEHPGSVFFTVTKHIREMDMLVHTALIALTTLTLVAQTEEQTETAPRPVEVVQNECASLRDLAETDLGRAFYDSSNNLPEFDEERTVYWNGSDRTALSEAAGDALSEEDAAAYRKLDLDEAFYYGGVPAAYGRTLDIAGRHGITDAAGLRVMDFGFGRIGHLRMLASLGASCTGIEILEILKEFYSDTDTGTIHNENAPDGHINLVYGSYPGDEAVAKAVGTGYDLFITKNTLKLGYIHPQRETEDRFLVHLGVTDAEYLRALHDALNPGALIVVYNLYPTQKPEPETYIPWATGEFPFDRTLTEETGFEVLEWNIDDTAYAKEMAGRLGWDAQMDIENDLNGMYTVLRKG